MNELVIRDSATTERLARGLAIYHSRRQRGAHCRDPLEPLERARVDDRRNPRLQSARQFVAQLRPASGT